MSKKTNYIAALEVGGVRRIHYFKSLSVSHVIRTVKRNKPDATIIRIYPEPHLFEENIKDDSGGD